MKMHPTLKIALAFWLFALVPLPADAEVTALRLARQYGIGYLQTIVMEKNKLIEKHAKARGMGDVTASWSTFADGTVASDAILSGNLDYAAGGLGSFMTLWDRTRGSLGVKGVAALNSMPMLLNTRHNVWGENSQCDAIRLRRAVLHVPAVMVPFAPCANFSSSPSIC